MHPWLKPINKLSELILWNSGNKTNISIDPLVHHVYSSRMPLTLFPPSSLSPVLTLFQEKQFTMKTGREEWYVGAACYLWGWLNTSGQHWVVSWVLLFPALLSACLVLPDIFKVLSFHFLRQLLTFLPGYVVTLHKYSSGGCPDFHIPHTLHW